MDARVLTDRQTNKQTDRQTDRQTNGTNQHTWPNRRFGQVTNENPFEHSSILDQIHQNNFHHVIVVMLIGRKVKVTGDDHTSVNPFNKFNFICMFVYNMCIKTES